MKASLLLLLALMLGTGAIATVVVLVRGCDPVSDPFLDEIEAMNAEYVRAWELVRDHQADDQQRDTAYREHRKRWAADSRKIHARHGRKEPAWVAKALGE